jgi:hypothetical protein
MYQAKTTLLNPVSSHTPIITLQYADVQNDPSASRPRSLYSGAAGPQSGDMRGLTPPPTMRRDSEGVWSEDGSEVLLAPPDEPSHTIGKGGRI